MNVYKDLDDDGRSSIRKFPYPLPNGKTPGEWVEVSGKPHVGVFGLHGHKRRQPGKRQWVMEVAGEIDESGGMVAATRARILRRASTAPIRGRKVRAGLLACLRCGKAHWKRDFGHGVAPSWADPKDGHSYQPEPFEEWAARAIARYPDLALVA